MKKLNCPENETLYPLHGGNRRIAIRELKMSDGQLIDFSASINPLGPAPNVRFTLREMESQLVEYPDPDATSFCEKISEYLRVPVNQVLATNGSTELIHLLPKLLGRGKEVLILNPCFSEYERAFRLNQVCVHSLNYDIEQTFHVDPVDVIRHCREHPGIEMLILGHPNNPTGHAWSEDSLNELAQYCKSQKIILVVDETFIEFCSEAVSALKWMESNSYLIVIRSMTKFFGLAGVRLGYGIMHPDLRKRIKRFQIPWSVNALAQKMGIAALGDIDYAQKTRQMIQEQRQYLFSELKGLKKIKVFPSHANFLLFQLTADGAEIAHKFYVDLMKEGVLIRNCGNFNGLDQSYFRIAVRVERENRILVSRIEDQLGKER